MKKRIVMFGAVAGMTAGGAVPLLWGGSPLGGWSILCGLIGGFIGIWLGAKAAEALGE